VAETALQRAGTTTLLAHDDAHVWHVRLDQDAHLLRCEAVLSADERARRSRYYTEDLRNRFAIAHGAKRLILAGYVGIAAPALTFETGAFGKPRLVNTTSNVRFNLSHSGDIALIAVARGREVGVDVEQWKERVEHTEVAEYCFSRSEQERLERVAGTAAVEGAFFAAWSRKEAYIKALGVGITQGLDHFDVAMLPGETIGILDDRRDPGAGSRWCMHELDCGRGYSAALVVEAPLHSVQSIAFV
jgi:4'-phosphopantetheinyl transferase